jgi:glycosyltransferase involved in cell wall biosynthesis
MASELRKIFLVDLLALTPFYDRYLAEALQAQVPTTLYAASFPYEPDYFATTSVQRATGLLDRVAHLGITNKNARRALSLGEYAFNWTKLIADVRRERPEIVHVQWLPLLEQTEIELRGIERIRALGARVVYTAHNALPHDSGEKHKTRYRNAYAAMDRILVHTERERQRLHEQLQVERDKIDLVPHGPMFHDMPWLERDTARRELDVPADAQVVLSAGILRPYKGIEDLLDAMPRILARHPKALLLIAGQGETSFVQRLHDRAKSLRVEAHVKLITRYIPVREIPGLHAAADVVALPYRNASQSGMLFTTASFDAPLVATEVGGLAELLAGTDRAVLVPPSHPVALADAIARVLSLPEQARREQAGLLREWVRREQSWHIAAQRTLESYRRALGSLPY